MYMMLLYASFFIVLYNIKGVCVEDKMTRDYFLVYMHLLSPTNLTTQFSQE